MTSDSQGTVLAELLLIIENNKNTKRRVKHELNMYLVM